MSTKHPEASTPQAQNTTPVIKIRGAKQNNLKNLDLDIRTGELTVVTGLSGSGKSSLVFDTLYAEGQRRYVETFSPYARQFLDRMDRPHVDAIKGVPPAIAIDQTGVVRTSRSTVGTMTGANDLVKLLFAHNAHAFCPDCGEEVRHYTPQSIFESLEKEIAQLSEDTRVYLTFEVTAPTSLPIETVEAGLSAQGFSKILARRTTKKEIHLSVVLDRFKANRLVRERAIDAVEQGLEKGAGKIQVFLDNGDGKGEKLWHTYRQGFVCAHCDTTFREPMPSLFSFNSPLGACETCKGFGRVMSIDPNLVIPDPTLSLYQGAIRVASGGKTGQELQEDLMKGAYRMGVRVDVPYQDLTEEEKTWVWGGDKVWKAEPKHPSAGGRRWYGLDEFFGWLESHSYKMHIRVLLSRYRAYTPCPVCGGAHLKAEALNWRYGTAKSKAFVLANVKDASTVLFEPLHMKMSKEKYESLPGFHFYELTNLPVEVLHKFCLEMRPTADKEEAMVLDEVISRLSYLCDVGLGYLTLDRQSRTLSGGEVQRVNLTTALGTSLVNTLFVLDEPSIGLHPRDMDRVNSVMERLSRAGNTLVVVEHDPQVMLAADRLIDLGPNAGKYGGEIIFDGDTRSVLTANTETALYLSGKKRISRAHPKAVTKETLRLGIEGASEHNLKNIDVQIPLQRFVAVAGVSGAGKSTLIADVLVPAVDRQLKTGTSTPGAYKRLSGVLPTKLAFVDQSPIGRTTRGNPVSYVHAFDGIRYLFAETPEASVAKLSYKDFSFNSGEGRCPVCGGAGTEHVEMQFLSDVYLPCPACHGKRYRDSVLEVKITLRGKQYNIAEVLDLTVDEACELFSHVPNVMHGLRHLQSVGLGYLTLGQPLTTLSGSETQRLKLASHLADNFQGKATRAGTLFIFDEPTTGLHFKDIARLVNIFDSLVAMGHSVLVVEHNLDILNVADWVIELGPEGGEQGGYLMFEGTPDELVTQTTHTGRALHAWRETQEGRNTEAFFHFPDTNRALLPHPDEITVEGAREHNLQNLSVSIPHNEFTVITGPSGSGKSTLAFDIIFAEGQRRYLESLNAYARTMVQPPPLPDVDAVRGIPPSVAIEQRTSRGGLRSTVATMTEIYHFLRLIFGKLGTQYCPDCHVDSTSRTEDEIAQIVLDRWPKKKVELWLPLAHHRKGSFKTVFAHYQKLGLNEFLIDGVRENLLGKTNHSLVLRVEHDVSVCLGTMSTGNKEELKREITKALSMSEERAIFVCAANQDSNGVYLSTRSSCPSCQRSFAALDPKLFSYNSPVGTCPTCSGYGILTDAIKKAQKAEETLYNEEVSSSDDSNGMDNLCPTCHGQRLNEVALAVLWKKHNIAEFGAMTINEMLDFFSDLKLTPRETAIAGDAIKEIVSRLHFLQEVGLNYLTLDRSAPTLSGGEAQRIRLAAQLGSNLRGACYVLDEPTIGLHPRDNQMLLNVIETLTHKGNTLLVVEHDEDTIRRAGHIIDIGPGAGTLGGKLVAEGSLKEVMGNKNSITGKFLKNPLLHTGEPDHAYQKGVDSHLEVIAPKLRNLKIDDLEIPLGKLVVMTGVSGSGKSTLMHEILYKNLAPVSTLKKGQTLTWHHCQEIKGWEKIRRVLHVDQTPIGKTPRSCPATYVGFYEAIRDLFAGLPESQARGYDARRFTFNLAGGRCEECGGQGFKVLAMNFLPDVKVECDVCHGSRFNPETLAVTWREHNIGDILRLSVNDAVDLFESHPSIARPLKLMQDVGLGYLKLGQPSPTLSGGEAQRLKLVTELAKVKDTPTRPTRLRTSLGTVYVLDEPTVGLHMNDVAKLIDVLKRLVANGNTVVVIEHNLDVMAEADWIIDLGPEAGSQGGQLCGEGTPKAISELPTHTGVALKIFLQEHRPKRSASKKKSSEV